jgi:hypothetical protein
MKKFDPFVSYRLSPKESQQISRPPANKLTRTGLIPLPNMATNLTIWTTIGIVIGALAILPSIMGLFGKNKFVVNGKVRRKGLPISSLV